MKTSEVKHDGQRNGMKFMSHGAQQKIVEVFRTNVQDERDAGMIINRLQQKFPGSRVNFDLQDCDKVLRIVSYPDQLDFDQVVEEVNISGFSIEAL